MPRICLVEDDHKLRENLTRFLVSSPNVESVESFPDAESVLAEAIWEKFDVLIVDLELPGLPGAEVIRQARQHHTSLPCLVYTIHEDRESAFAALRAGACGYLLKGGSPREFLQGILATVNGHPPMSPAIARFLLDEFLGQSKMDSAEHLSHREQEILGLLAHGLIYKEIAERLRISPHTTHTHIKHIYAKLHACNRQHALRRARMRGYLT